MKQRVVELHYSVAETAFLYRFSETTIREKLKAGDFGPLDQEEAERLGLGRLLNVNEQDIRIPVSRCLYFEARHSFQYSPGIKARNTAEMKRKLCAAARAQEEEAA